MPRLKKVERETVIEYVQSETEARVATYDRPLIRRLIRLGIEPEVAEKEFGRIFYAEFVVPRSWLRVSPPRRVTEAQKESARRLIGAINDR